MNIEIIKFGLPKGSLNTPGRGDTKQMLLDAGYDIRGYESGKESPTRLSILNDPEIKPFLRRPEGSPVELDRKLLDIAITGADWIEEERINGGLYGVRKIGDLEYGSARIVIAVAEKSGWKSLDDILKDLNGRGRKRPILCSTEYVNLTARAFMQCPTYQELFGEKSPFIQYRGLTRGRNRSVQILGSDGATEASIAMGMDLIVDVSQSGQSLIDNNLREIGQIMESSAGLYAGPGCIGWKENKAQEIFTQLQGVIDGKEVFSVAFNIPSALESKLRKDFTERGFCADEPTLTLGEKFASGSILIPRKIFPKVLQILRRDYCASAIVRSEVKQYIK